MDPFAALNKLKLIELSDVSEELLATIEGNPKDFIDRFFSEFIIRYITFDN